MKDTEKAAVGAYVDGKMQQFEKEIAPLSGSKLLVYCYETFGVTLPYSPKSKKSILKKLRSIAFDKFHAEGLDLLEQEKSMNEVNEHDSIEQTKVEKEDSISLKSRFKENKKQITRSTHKDDGRVSKSIYIKVDGLECPLLVTKVCDGSYIEASPISSNLETLGKYRYDQFDIMDTKDVKDYARLNLNVGKNALIKRKPNTSDKGYDIWMHIFQETRNELIGTNVVIKSPITVSGCVKVELPSGMLLYVPKVILEPVELSVGDNVVIPRLPLEEELETVRRIYSDAFSFDERFADKFVGNDDLKVTKTFKSKGLIRVESEGRLTPYKYTFPESCVFLKKPSQEPKKQSDETPEPEPQEQKEETVPEIKVGDKVSLVDKDHSEDLQFRQIGEVIEIHSNGNVSIEYDETNIKSYSAKLLCVLDSNSHLAQAHNLPEPYKSQLLKNYSACQGMENETSEDMWLSGRFSFDGTSQGYRYWWRVCNKAKTFSQLAKVPYYTVYFNQEKISIQEAICLLPKDLADRVKRVLNTNESYINNTTITMEELRDSGNGNVEVGINKFISSHMTGFIWRNTNEGFDFWKNTIDLLNSSDLKKLEEEYLRLISKKPEDYGMPPLESTNDEIKGHGNEDPKDPEPLKIHYTSKKHLQKIVEELTERRPKRNIFTSLNKLIERSNKIFEDCGMLPVVYIRK